MTDFLGSASFSVVVNILSVIGVLASFAFFVVQMIHRNNDKRWLTDMANSLETRYLGDFPIYLPDVAKLLAGATKSIKIMSMISSHGSFTDEYHWREIRRCLQDDVAEKIEQRKLIQVELVYGTRRALEKNAQFYTSLNDQEWRDWRQANIDVISKFLSKQYGLNQAQSSNIPNELYRECRYFEHIKTCLDVYGMFQKYRCEERLPLYCWIVDDARVIFSVSTENASGRYHGSGVYTADPALVSSMKAMFEYYRDTHSGLADPTRLAHYEQAEAEFRLKRIGNYRKTII